ncbi:MAG: nucleotide sugar dehydrogenase [Candidatus Hydrogenedentes bacterium]|nr:nucleotide sugar dehydrogenase [Candidatus Hydrogenedentota bacterium]
MSNEGKIEKVAVLGMGYVGVPLAIEFLKGGLQVWGIDKDPEKISILNSGGSYLDDISDTDVRNALATNRFYLTDEYGVLSRVDAVCICVPTPLTKLQEPDLSYVIEAVDNIVPYLHKGMLVVLESTTYPGTTEEVVLPRLSRTGMVVGQDFHLAFSPERYDPGNKKFGIRNTPKVVGGVTSQCTTRAIELYKYAVDTVVPVSNARTAEMVKLLENTFRAVNIALVNEMTMICERLNIDIWEVIESAKTKPFGFMPFYPGPGLGGHCIPVDPVYLSWKMKTLNYEARFIELARSINSSMPRYIVEKVGDILNSVGKTIRGSNILILGVTYKRDVSDIRESPAIDVISMLTNKGAEVSYSDPHIHRLKVNDSILDSFPIQERGLGNFDLIIIVTDHSSFDIEWIVKEGALIFDTRNATKDIYEKYRNKIIKL